MKKTIKKLIIFLVFTLGIFPVFGNNVEALTSFTNSSTNSSSSSSGLGASINPPTIDFKPTIVSEYAMPKMISATLNGSVNPNGSNTNVWYESSATGRQQLQLTNIGKGTLAVPLPSYNLTGLTPNTDYRFRVVASNANATVQGNWTSFKTSGYIASVIPTLISVSPSIGAQGQNINVSLTGTGFTSNSTVVFYGSGISVNPDSTTINSETSITVHISISSTAPIGISNVAVVNTNGTSNTKTFSVVSYATSCLVPTIFSISPSSVTAGSGTINLMIYGSNFNNTTSVFYNESIRTSTYINSSTLSVVLTATDTSSVGTGDITVSNGTNCVSNPIPFFIISNGNGNGGGGGGNHGGGSGSYIIHYVGVITQNATSVLKTTAIVNGLINPNGYATTAWYEYGTSSNLITFNETGHISLGLVSYNLTFPQKITGLSPNTTYYFRAVGNNSSGTVRGNILSFTTPKNIIINNTVNENNNTNTKTPTVNQNTNTNNSIENTIPQNEPVNQTFNTNQPNNEKSFAAAVILGFTNILPKSFLGWLTLLILISLIVLIARKLYQDYTYQKSIKELGADHIENLPF